MASSNGEPQRVEGLTGAVTRGRFGAGSKSEREAVYFETATGRFVPRRKAGPTFGDRALKKYVGKRVRCDGFIVGYMLLAERIEMLR